MKDFKSFLTLAFCSVFIHTLISGKAAKAQVSPDGSLPTNVNQSGETIEITGGEQAGSNLFHSFEQFSVPAGQAAFFNNAANISNIISRVTGGSISEIDGLIRANGGANFFLLNPNGIIFGPDAALDIGGSFLATTADSLIFEDKTVFDAQNPQDPLLTVSMPISLQVGLEAGSIINQSKVGEGVGLEVNPVKNFTLVGGDINLDGGNITAPGGQVNLGGLAASGTVNFTDNQLTFENSELLANVSLDNQAMVDVSSNGGITVNAQDFSLTNESQLLAGIAEGFTSAESETGDINVKTTDSISVESGSNIQTDTSGVGNAGDINLESENGSVSFVGLKTFASTQVEREAKGEAGDINITAHNLTLTTKGDSGFPGAYLEASTKSQGNAGNITIRVEDTVNFHGATSSASSTVGEGAVGQGGNIDIQARSLSITKGASVLTGTRGQGDAGNINIDTSDSLVVSGTAPPTLADGEAGGFSSALITETNEGASGQGGDIKIDTNNLQVKDGGVLSGRSRSDFPGGNITVNAENLSISGGGQILTTAFGQGAAGNIKLNVSNNINISGSDPSFDERFNSVKQQFGLAVAESRIDSVDPGNSGVYANTTGDSTGDSGSIFISTENLQLSRGGRISTNAVNSDGGSIFINTTKLEALNNSDISANAQQGTGGLVVINAQNISGTEAREALTPQSDITASSELGPQFSGIVSVSNLEIYSAVKLPQEPVKGQIVQSCQATGSQDQSEFTVTGSGGLSPNPSESLRSSAIAINVANSATSQHEQNTAQSQSIVEAQGWIVNERGNVVLTARTNNAKGASNFLPATSGCSR